MTDRVHAVLSPPINATGIYTVYEPFTISITTIYRCSAIRSFSELIKRGVDVYTTYYLPYSIDESVFKADLALNASMLTLVDGAGVELYIPNTYLQSYPGDTGMVYERKILVAELGILPNAVDVSYLIPLIQDVIAKNVGVVDNTIEIVVAPFDGAVTHEQYIELETARTAAINNYETLQEQVNRLSKSLSDALEQNTLLTEALATANTSA